MQSIQHNHKNIHPIFDAFERAYALTSAKYQKSELVTPVFDSAFISVFKLFEEYGGIKYKVNYKNTNMPKIAEVRNRNNVVLCFSGGKDSIAVAKILKDQGKNVYLYHLRRINPPLYDEYIASQKLADYMKLPLYIDEVKLSGKHDYVEHPLKNMMIANGALQYAIRNNIGTNIAFGNYTTSTLRDDNFEFCAGDDVEMWDAYNSIMQTVIPKFEMHIALGNLWDTLDSVCPDKEVLELSVSCLGRASMRQYWHDWVKRKYDINLPKHRCGRCYKCCIEYIYMTDRGLQEYNKEYYKYCLNNLKKNFEREDGVKYSEQEVWNHYFPYDMENGKYYRTAG